MTTTRQPLDKALRRTLEATVIKARDIAELAATQALNRLGVGDAKPTDYLDDQQRKLRTRLRARGRQLGDIKNDNGQQATHKLVTEVAYEHWHRMLFARFLEQNNLLMYDEYTPLSLDECNELAQDSDTARDDLERRCESGWELAGVLASKMLPQIFRIDSPVFELELAPEHQRSLEQLVTRLSLETFQAQDSLGWVYQFWQSKRKEEVNKSEVKIGADELSPVTQLFTEPYMVSFLLDNALGAWWADQRLTESDWQQARSEQELRNKAAIPGLPLTYLRFVQDETTQQWQPASGTFDAWPKHLSEFKTLDPCCGSGHFLVAVFLMLVPMRMQLESLTEQQAIDKVLSENLHGLELDQRCVEIAAFAVAIEAWRYPESGGYRSLPDLHLACSGLAIDVKQDELLRLAENNNELRMSFVELSKQFKDAPILGSLINPKGSIGKDSLSEVEWAKVAPLLARALISKQDSELREIGVAASGVSKAATLMSDRYHLVITNVPYLGREGHTDELKVFADKYYPEASGDLATLMLERIFHYIGESGVAFTVLPQNWWVGRSYTHYRKSIVKNKSILLAVTLGEEAWETFGNRGPNTILLGVSNSIPKEDHHFFALDVSSKPGKPIINRADKDLALRGCSKDDQNLILKVSQNLQMNNPDVRISLQPISMSTLLNAYVVSGEGSSTGDADRFLRFFWEVVWEENWIPYLTPDSSSCAWGGRELLMFWQNGLGTLAQSPQARIQNTDLWSRKGILVGRVRGISTTLFDGGAFSKGGVLIIPNREEDIPSIYSFLRSNEYENQVRALDPRVSASTSVLTKVGFDMSIHTGNKLPLKTTNIATQWIFHGHPCGSVIIREEDTKCATQDELRVDYSVLQVAVARLLGHQWPAELDTEIELAAEQRRWIERSQQLNQFTDDDGIVCLPAVRGEKSADQRLESLLQAAYGEAWTTPLKNRLLETVGGKSLNQWLRDKFFEQHCKMFQHRPFIWHIWDGLNDGFSALVNYHMLDKAGLERLIYTYLGDWIRTQQSGMASGEDGAQERLAAAEALKRELEAILQGEAPYDIFVRWKPLAEQPIGWNPDINDGVRLNIRPFLKARDVGKKDAGVLRWKPNVKWTKDRGKDVESAPWYTLGLEYEGKEGDRINDNHLTLVEKRAARD